VTGREASKMPHAFWRQYLLFVLLLVSIVAIEILLGRVLTSYPGHVVLTFLRIVFGAIFLVLFYRFIRRIGAESGASQN
jgi:hypothetical protein